MKEYIVTIPDYDRSIWLVTANGAKDAIDQVWIDAIHPMNVRKKQENTELGFHLHDLCGKTEIHARSIASLHSEDGKIVDLWRCL